MADGGGKHHLAIGNLGIERPQVKNHSVCLGGGIGEFLGFLGRQVQDLNPSACDFFLVIVEVLIPLFQRHIAARELLVDEVLDLDEFGIRVASG